MKLPSRGEAFGDVRDVNHKVFLCEHNILNIMLKDS